jgi:CPA2 family monovalent cation:H+ antiporter-2
LRELALRGRTGATVIAIRREPGETIYPSADEVLRKDDLVVLTGTQEAVEQAKQLLT